MQYTIPIRHSVGPYLYIGGDKISRILENCTWTTSSYIPTPWLTRGNSHTQSAINRGEPLREKQYEREILMAANTSTVSIDWFDHPENIVKEYLGLIVIFNHGLNGRLSNGVIRAVGEVAASRKLGVCVVNLQGTSGLPMSSANIGMGLSFIVEYKAVTERLTQHVGASFPKTAVGMSIGGVPLIEYLGLEKGFFSSLILISCPLNLERFGLLHNLVTDYMMEEGRCILKANADFVTKSEPEAVTKALEAMTTLNEFLNLTVAKPWGHANILTGYAAVDPYSHLDSMTRPTLLVYALDDDAIDLTGTIDLLRLCRNRNIAVAVTEAGGHCGFRTLGKDWLATLVTEFADSASNAL